MLDEGAGPAAAAFDSVLAAVDFNLERGFGFRESADRELVGGLFARVVSEIQ